MPKRLCARRFSRHDATWNPKEMGGFSKLDRLVSIGSTQESTVISLDAIEHLPRRLQNKYFYASWLPKLLAEGQLQAAGQAACSLIAWRVRPPNAIVMLGSLVRLDSKQTASRASTRYMSMKGSGSSPCSETGQGPCAAPIASFPSFPLEPCLDPPPNPSSMYPPCISDSAI